MTSYSFTSTEQIVKMGDIAIWQELRL